MKLPLPIVLTVSELTQEIKDLLENQFPDIWVEGEISNFRIPPSGHIYFTLKDESSQIRAVLFRSQARALRFVPQDGHHVICRGRVGLYEKRGEYQLILEAMEPKGIGALQLAFLQLKEKLEREGLFEDSRKKAVPMVPQAIGIVTSPTGAVIRDMLHVFDRRFSNLHILLYPVRVQGEGASTEIAEGIDYFNRERNVDVLIVGRGGGSLEDLWSFNEEVVARAIARSRIPVVSAVGHETDYTIADFVADLRAPTPSAAAELVVRDKRELRKGLGYLTSRLESEMLQNLGSHRTRLVHLRKVLGSPRKIVEDDFLRVDELTNRFRQVTVWILRRNRERGHHLAERLYLRSPVYRTESLREGVHQWRKRFEGRVRHGIEMRRQRLDGWVGKLASLNPLAILQRGYSITRRVPSLEILRSASRVGEGDRVEVRLHEGTLLCDVKKAEMP